MIKKAILFVVLIIIALLLASCVKPASKTVTISEADKGSVVQLKQGDILEVALSGNPSTGFSWQADDLDESILKPKGEWDFSPRSDDSNLIGGGGTMTVRYEIARKGKALLRLLYRQSFDPDTPPEKSFEVSVIVN